MTKTITTINKTSKSSKSDQKAMNHAEQQQLLFSEILAKAVHLKKTPSKKLAKMQEIVRQLP